jgi:hypothetical protein
VWGPAESGGSARQIGSSFAGACYAGDDGGVRFHGVDIRDHVGIHESDVQGRHRDAVARIPHARRRSEPTARV